LPIIGYHFGKQAYCFSLEILRKQAAAYSLITIDKRMIFSNQDIIM